MIERKGFPYLIHAMKIVRATYSDAMLFLGGEGPEQKNIAALVNELGLDENICLIGRVADDLMPYYYSAADVFVIPSIVDSNGDTEGLGLVAVEAMACRTPVVGTSVGGIPDIIDDGINGFLVPEKNPIAIAEKITYLLKNSDGARRMAHAGREKVEMIFNWDVNVKKTIEIYELLLSSKSDGVIER